MELLKRDAMRVDRRVQFLSEKERIIERMRRTGQHPEQDLQVRACRISPFELFRVRVRVRVRVGWLWAALSEILSDPLGVRVRVTLGMAARVSPSPNPDPDWPSREKRSSHQTQ